MNRHVSCTLAEQQLLKLLQEEADANGSHHDSSLQHLLNTQGAWNDGPAAEEAAQRMQELLLQGDRPAALQYDLWIDLSLGSLLDASSHPAH